MPQPETDGISVCDLLHDSRPDDILTSSRTPCPAFPKMTLLPPSTVNVAAPHTARDPRIASRLALWRILVFFEVTIRRESAFRGFCDVDEMVDRMHS